MLKYVQAGGTVVCLGLSAATATVGNTEIAGLFAALPVSYWIIHAALRAKRISDERRKARMNEIEATYAKLAKERDERRAQEGLQTHNEAQQRYTAQQQQRNAFLRSQMDLQAMALQQRQMADLQRAQLAQQSQRYAPGYSDPRAVQGMGFMDTMLATAIGNAVGDAISAGVGVTRTRTEETGAVSIEHVPVREVYRSADTSSDSFSSSDTGSDSS
jgi:hypothetical protein